MYVFIFFFFKPETEYDIFACSVGSDVGIRDRWVCGCANRRLVGLGGGGFFI